MYVWHVRYVQCTLGRMYIVRILQYVEYYDMYIWNAKYVDF